MLIASNMTINKWTHYTGIWPVFLLRNSKIWSNHFDCLASPVAL